jgi:hypothetical protein
MHTNVSTIQPVWMLFKKTDWMTMKISCVGYFAFYNKNVLHCKVKVHSLLYHCHLRVPAQNVSSRSAMSTQHDWHTGNDKKVNIMMI